MLGALTLCSLLAEEQYEEMRGRVNDPLDLRALSLPNHALEPDRFCETDACRVPTSKLRPSEL